MGVRTAGPRTPRSGPTARGPQESSLPGRGARGAASAPRSPLRSSVLPPHVGPGRLTARERAGVFGSDRDGTPARTAPGPCSRSYRGFGLSARADHLALGSLPRRGVNSSSERPRAVFGRATAALAASADFRLSRARPEGHPRPFEVTFGFRRRVRLLLAAVRRDGATREADQVPRGPAPACPFGPGAASGALGPPHAPDRRGARSPGRASGQQRAPGASRRAHPRAA